MSERSTVMAAAREIGIDLDPNWRGVDPVLPILESMRAEGAVVLIKLDGERKKCVYTLLCSWDPKEGGFARIDTDCIEEGLVHIITKYYGSK